MPTVAKYIDTSTCIGCKACEVACQEWNDLPNAQTAGPSHGTYQTLPTMTANFWNLIKFREVESKEHGLQWLMRKDQCMHCDDPGCLEACPAPGAIVQYVNGIVDVDPEKCIGCGLCETGCPFDVPRYAQATNKMAKCTLCVDRVSVGLEPACIKACPTGALVFGTKEDMKLHAADRIEDLKSRGFENAGLYDPAGVSGTHVMYVLHHADEPHIYSGLPDTPHISGTVRLWKGITKPLAVAAMALAAVTGFFHYIRVGPNETDEGDEARAADEMAKTPSSPEKRP
jgi:formate dehydrogenase iron-sulfur subunit